MTYLHWVVQFECWCIGGFSAKLDVRRRVAEPGGQLGVTIISGVRIDAALPSQRHRDAYRQLMSDHLSPKARSAHMRLIRKTGTKPEMRVRRAAHSLRYRFRLHRNDLPGTPDLLFPRLRKVVQVHGCFWHQHPGCRLARQPKSRLDYWVPKLERNRARDLETTAALHALGWSVLVVWECQVPDDQAAARILGPFLGEANGYSAGAAAKAV